MNLDDPKPLGIDASLCQVTIFAGGCRARGSDSGVEGMTAEWSWA